MIVYLMEEQESWIVKWKKQGTEIYIIKKNTHTRTHVHIKQYR